MTNAHHRSLSRSIEESPAVLVNNPAAFATRGDRIGFLEIPGEKSAARRHALSGKRL
jgi:hypothetical protein